MSFGISVLDITLDHISMLKHVGSLAIFFFLFPTVASLAASSSKLEDRLESCEPSVAISAADEFINSPDALKEPLQLLSPALTFFRNGKKDEAVFWFYAAQLRVRYQLASASDERNQGFLILGLVLSNEGIGLAINNYAFQDVSNFRQILDRVVAWDKSMPNPYPVRDKEKWMKIDTAIERMYSESRAQKERFIDERAPKESKAWLAAMEMTLQTEPIDPDFAALKAKLAAEKDALESRAILAAPVIKMANPKYFSYCRKR